MAEESTEERDEVILYRTPELYFAAYLCIIGVQMVTTEDEAISGNRKKLYFVFKVPRRDLTRLKAQYFSGTAKVPAKPYADKVRSLKQLCFA